jgi:hypothetical protein
VPPKSANFSWLTVPVATTVPPTSAAPGGAPSTTTVKVNSSLVATSAVNGPTPRALRTVPLSFTTWPFRRPAAASSAVPGTGAGSGAFGSGVCCSTSAASSRTGPEVASGRGNPATVTRSPTRAFCGFVRIASAVPVSSRTNRRVLPRFSTTTPDARTGSRASSGSARCRMRSRTVRGGAARRSPGGRVTSKSPTACTSNRDGSAELAVRSHTPRGACACFSPTPFGTGT